MSLEWGKGWTYRRARQLNDSEIPTNVNELIWRTDSPAGLGRANSEGFRVIYLADRTDTALSEIRVSQGTVVIAEFTQITLFGLFQSANWRRYREPDTAF